MWVAQLTIDRNYEEKYRNVTMKDELEEIKRRMQRLEDREEIKELIVTYARGMDHGNDPRIIGPLFAEDGTWESKDFRRFEGRKDVVAGLRAISGEESWHPLHYMISPTIDVAPDGNTAKAFWYFWEAANIPNEETKEPEAYWIGATLDADVVKESGQWLFKRMEFILNMASPFSEGWVRQRFPKARGVLFGEDD